MSLDVNEEDNNNYEGNFHYGVFKDNVRVRQTLKDGVTRLCIMPAFGDPGDPMSWIPYRNADSNQDSNGNHLFTSWIRRYYAYQFVGAKGNQGHFLAPKTFDSNAIDPIARMLEVAKRDRRYYEILGLGEDGKKSTDPDAFMSVLLQAPDELYAINAVCLNPAREEDEGVSCLYTLRKTMVNGKFDVKETGLLSQLNLKNRGVDGTVDPSDFANYYYWGDVTNITRLIPINILKVQVKGVSGKKSFPYFNATPDDKAQPITGTRKMLEGRYFLDDSFNSGVDPADTIERLVDIFQDFPDLIKKSFENQFPGIDNLLRQTGIISSSKVHTPSSGYESEEVGDLSPTNSTYRPGESASKKVVTPSKVDDLPAPTGRSFSPKLTEKVYAPIATGDLPAPMVKESKAPKAPVKTQAGNSAALNEEAMKVLKELDDLDLDRVS